jgi:arylsulfatase A-like enzyme
MTMRNALFPAALALGCLVGAGASQRDADKPKASCSLGNGAGSVEHVVYIQFDNTHLRRDRREVPSDLEQMPHLLSFIRENGTLLANDHTVLISHTAGGILSSLTGVYPDRHGQTVSNSYVRTSATGGFSFPSSFGYWTDPVSGTIPNMVTPEGVNAPAPWVPFTRAGCDVGAIAAANIVLENTGTGANGDVTKVFGNPSPQFSEALASNAAPSGSAARAKAQTDFVGLAVHCAKESAVCAAGHSDALPAEPGGYAGFKGLFGAQEINPFLTGGPTLLDLDGKPIGDPFGQPGFPGFDGMEATVTLAYVAAMHEKGIQVTYAYISDAHDFHGVSGNAHVAFGPGSAGYVQQLAAYDAAFAKFFARLRAAGIDRSNTLFVFTVDEGDHFSGGTPSPANCDGIRVPCDWTGQVGEINANIDTLVAHQFPSLAAQFLGAPAANAFTVHGDDAPTFYLARKGRGALAQTDALTREFERSIAKLTAVNPYTGTTDRLLAQMADQTGMKAVHMFTSGDPARNATFVLFADPNYFITDFPASTCETCINPAFAWNHGDIQPEIANTWLGFVGPGVKRQGEAAPWTDHADVRPTMLQLVGLSDSYELDGRVITEALDSKAHERSLLRHRETLERLGAAYKQMNAPFGAFGKAALVASTRALTGDDATYAAVEEDLGQLTAERDAIAAEIRTALNAAAFGGQSIDERQARGWIEEAESLIERAARLAGLPRAERPDESDD